MSQIENRIRIYETSTPMDVQAIDEMRLDKESSRKTRMGYAAGVAALVLAVGGALGYERATEPGTRTVPMIANYGDSLWTLTRQAESRYGKDPHGFNFRGEIARLQAEYGTTIQPGSTIEVHVK